MKENTISISVQEYTRLKDIETRFAILKEQMLQMEYFPLHWKTIFGIPADPEPEPIHAETMIARKEKEECTK